MGVYIGIAILFVVIWTNVITWAAASRVSLRRSADSPYRGKKLTGDEWKESVGEALVATPAAAWSYWAGLLAVMGAVYGLGLATDNLQDMVVDFATADQVSASVEGASVDDLSESIERNRDCAQRLANRPDPAKNLYDTFGHDRNAEWRGCEGPAEPGLLGLSSVQLVQGLEKGSAEVPREWEVGFISDDDRDFLDLIKERRRADDIAALTARLYGPTGRRGTYVESRIRYIILLALAENRAEGGQSDAALEYTLNWRQGDDSAQCVGVREQARELLTSLRRRSVDRQAE